MNTYALFKKGFMFIVYFLMVGTLTLSFNNFAWAEKQKPLTAFVAPDEIGPYKVGFIETTAVLFNGRVTPIRIWYPTLDNDVSGTYSLATPPGPDVQIKPYFQAQPNAAIANGKFPLIIDNHPSNAGNTAAALGSYPMNELLASHGFIVVGYLRSTTVPCLSTVNDPRYLIDMMLNKNQGVNGSTFNGVDFLNKIDPDKIGAEGISGGGVSLISLASGIAGNPAINVPAIPADSRVKALVMHEPSANNSATCGLTGPQWASINIPYLLTEGSPTIGPIQIPLFNGTVNALPRFKVHIPNVSHIGLQTGNCDLINQSREVSFARQLANNPSAFLQDPLLVSVSSAVDGGVGSRAFSIWNLDALAGASLGAGRQYCTNVGVHSQYLSTDANQDGITDTPPLGCTGPTSNLCATYTTPIQVPEKQLNKYLFTYTVAFFKVYLEGDPRYKHFLTEDWTGEHFPDITLTSVK